MNEFVEFEWDSKEAIENLRKHKVSFEEARTVFADPHAVIFDDEWHSQDAPREIIIGYSKANRLLLTVFIERQVKQIRILSARVADARERKKYEEEKRF